MENGECSSRYTHCHIIMLCIAYSIHMGLVIHSITAVDAQLHVATSSRGRWTHDSHSDMYQGYTIQYGQSVRALGLLHGLGSPIASILRKPVV